MFKILDFDKVILSQNKIPSLDEFKKAMKIEGNSFASNILIHLYNNIYKDSIDLKSEYLKYYSIEYRDLKSYLLYKVGIDTSGIELDSEHLLLIKPTASLFETACADNYLEFVLQVIEKNYENQI